MLRFNAPRMTILPGFKSITWSPAARIFFDESLPNWVKTTFLPQFKGEFNDKDVSFFSKGIVELSERFQERPHFNYFSDARFRSSYFLYFLPLHAAKFLTLFETHFDPKFFEGRVIQVGDLGAGSATASIAFLWWLDHHKIEPNVQLHWVDKDSKILTDAKNLFKNTLSNHFKNVQIKTYKQDWSYGVSKMLPRLDLALIGHCMNEMKSSSEDIKRIFGALSDTHPEKILWIEPAFKSSSHHLVAIRKNALEQYKILGPCLHQLTCPFSEGRDWCHFSFPAQNLLKLKWLPKISQYLGSEREWLKFSYLAFENQENSNKHSQNLTDSNIARVISNSIPSKGELIALLCQPEKPERMLVPKNLGIKRGDFVTIRTQLPANKKSN